MSVEFSPRHLQKTISVFSNSQMWKICVEIKLCYKKSTTSITYNFTVTKSSSLIYFSCEGLNVKFNYLHICFQLNSTLSTKEKVEVCISAQKWHNCLESFINSLHRTPFENYIISTFVSISTVLGTQESTPVKVSNS